MRTKQTTPTSHSSNKDNHKRGKSILTSRRTLLSNLGLAAIAVPTIAANPLQLLAVPHKGKQSKRSYRFAVGMFMQESSTFCPEVSSLERFRNNVLTFGDDVLPVAKTSISYLGGVMQAAAKHGIEVFPTVAASASPYGVVEKGAYEQITSGLYERLESAGQLDGIVFVFHGAMVSETTMDPEGEIIAAMRSIVGPDVPICCTFDFHCKVSQRMIDNADAFFYNNENPHVDSFDRGIEAAEACLRIASGEIEPVMVFKKPGMMVPTLNVRPPTSGPLVEIFNRAFEMEKDPRVININIGAGFPWCDVPDAGVNVVPVVHKDRQLAEDIAAELSERIWQVRHEFIPTSLVPLEEAVERAVSAKEGPVVLVDVADNPGDGTTMDSNSILRELYKQNAKNAAIAAIRQPDAVRKCLQAGVGADVTLELGCVHRVIGEPITMTARVKTLSDGIFYRASPTAGEGYANFGKTAVIENEGIEVIITERTGPSNFPQIFLRNGIDPTKKKILVIKTFKMYSEPHFRSIAREMIEVDAPGQATPNLTRLTWKHIPRPMFPIDDV